MWTATKQLILISTVGLAAGLAWRQDKAGQDSQDKLKGLPPAVRAAAEKALAGAVATEADKETEHGCEQYEINGKTKEGLAVSFTFSPTGELMVEERVIALEKVPAAVTAALAKKFPNAKTLRAEVAVKHSYEVTVEVDGKKHAVEVQANGAIAGTESAEEEGNEGKQGKDGKSEKK